MEEERCESEGWTNGKESDDGSNIGMIFFLLLGIYRLATGHALVWLAHFLV